MEEFEFDDTRGRDFALQFCRRRWPELTEAELQEAAENLTNYLRVIWKIQQRQIADGSAEEFQRRLRAEKEYRMKQYLVDRLCDLLVHRIIEIGYRSKARG